MIDRRSERVARTCGAIAARYRGVGEGGARCDKAGVKIRPEDEQEMSLQTDKSQETRVHEV